MPITTYVDPLQHPRAFAENPFQYVNDLMNIAIRVNMVVSLLLGFLAYTFFASLPFDYRLIKSVFQKRPTFFMALNRIAYFISKYLGMTFFIMALILIQAPKEINCKVATRYHESVFYLPLVANHWLFASRKLAIWRTHPKFRYMFAYVVVTMAAISTLSVLSFLTAGMGTETQAFGCIYLVNERTLPAKKYSASLATLYVEQKRPTFFRALRCLCSQMSFRKRKEGDVQPYTVLKQSLLEQDLGQYIMRLCSLIFFILIPLFSLRDDTVLLMSGFALYMAIDIEIGGRVFRGTIKAVQKPKSIVTNIGVSSNPFIADIHHPTAPSSATLTSEGSYHGKAEKSPTSVLDPNAYEEEPFSFLTTQPSGFSGRRGPSLNLPPIATSRDHYRRGNDNMV